MLDNIKKNKKIITLILIVSIMAVYLLCSGFASTERFAKTLESDMNGGLDRIVVIYTYTGKELARYEGLIDLEVTNVGKLLFDLDGKRYIYYNCIVEVIEK